MTLVGSRFTHAAEFRYAPIEGEALAVVEALSKARFFVLGCSDLQVVVDHKPLLKIFGDQHLNDISNPKLRNLKEKTLPYRFRMVHIQGVRHKAADALSRNPTGDPKQLVLNDDIADASSVTTPLQVVTTDRVRVASSTELHDLTEMIESGFPNAAGDMPGHLRHFFRFRDQLATADGVILYGDRIVIPPSLQKEVLNALHSAHQGVTSMLSRADTSVFWPGITADIQEMREYFALDVREF